MTQGGGDGCDGRACGREILVRLLDLTPPPPTEGDLAQLIAGFEAIVEARAGAIAQIAPPVALADDDRPLLAELVRRQAAWLEALGAAHQAVGNQRCGAAQLRAYAPTV
jgi:hypothetical protein